MKGSPYLEPINAPKKPSKGNNQSPVKPPQGSAVSKPPIPKASASAQNTLSLPDSKKAKSTTALNDDPKISPDSAHPTDRELVDLTALCQELNNLVPIFQEGCRERIRFQE